MGHLMPHFPSRPFSGRKVVHHSHSHPTHECGESHASVPFHPLRKILYGLEDVVSDLIGVVVGYGGTHYTIGGKKSARVGWITSIQAGNGVFGIQKVNQDVTFFWIENKRIQKRNEWIGFRRTILTKAERFHKSNSNPNEIWMSDPKSIQTSSKLRDDITYIPNEYNLKRRGLPISGVGKNSEHSTDFNSPAASDYIRK